MLKTLKMFFYRETKDENLKEKYLNYYFDTHPVFKRKFLVANDTEKEKLIDKAIKNAKAVYDDFVAHNFRLVVNVALKEHKKFSSLNLEKIDLIQEGNLGMMHAIKKFDIDTGYAFSTYAIWWIRAYVHNYIMKYGRTIYLSSWLLEMFKKYAVARDTLTEELGEKPTLEQIAVYMNEPIYKVEEIVRYRHQFLSLNSINEYIGDEEDSEIGDFIPDDSKSVENETVDKIFAEEVYEIIQKSNLNAREKDIIMKRNGIDSDIYTLEQIGEQYGITRERVRQIETTAMRKLQRALNNHNYNLEESIYGGKKTKQMTL